MLSAINNVLHSRRTSLTSTENQPVMQLPAISSRPQSNLSHRAPSRQLKKLTSKIKLTKTPSAIDVCYYLPPHKRAVIGSEELKEYTQVFSMFDTQRTGSIGIPQLETAMQSLGLITSEGELAEIITEVDQDGNGAIDFDEFCDVMKRLNTKSSWKDTIQECFRVFDRSETGEIRMSDFRYILQNYGHIDDEELIEELFMEFDVDRNGCIDDAEFAQFVKSYMTDDDL